jgi:hypothetical protein
MKDESTQSVQPSPKKKEEVEEKKEEAEPKE